MKPLFTAFLSLPKIKLFFSGILRLVMSVTCLQVALVFPNNDPVMFMVAFYGCLLAELVPVPIEVPLTRKVNTSQNLLGMKYYLYLYRCIEERQ